MTVGLNTMKVIATVDESVVREEEQSRRWVEETTAHGSLPEGERLEGHVGRALADWRGRGAGAEGLAQPGQTVPETTGRGQRAQARTLVSRWAQWREVTEVRFDGFRFLREMGGKVSRG